MLTKGNKKHLANPILGILPFALYIVLSTSGLLPLQSFLISIGATAIGIVGLQNYFSSKIQSLTFYITGLALTSTALLWAVAHDSILVERTYILVCEILIIIQLMFFHMGKTFLKARLVKQKSFLEKALINDFFNVATLLRYCLTIHLLLVLLYKQITVGYQTPVADIVLYHIVPLVLIVGLCILQFYRTNAIVNKLRQEEWLPIVSENGDVTGKIAKGVSKNLKNEHMHPVVRIALVCNKKLYLQERDDSHILNAGKMDHPFEKYMLFRHEINQAAHNSIKRMLGRDINSNLDFVFKYEFKNEITKRLIFLFVVKIDDESLVKRTNKMTGKFWTVKQIDAEFGNQIFSECFELEYEYLKHVVLLEDAGNLIAKNREGDSLM